MYRSCWGVCVCVFICAYMHVCMCVCMYVCLCLPPEVRGGCQVFSPMTFCLSPWDNICHLTGRLAIPRLAYWLVTLSAFVSLSPHMSQCLNYRATVRSGFYVGTDDGKLRSLQACAEITLPNEPSLSFGYDYLFILCIVSLVCTFNLIAHYPLSWRLSLY